MSMFLNVILISDILETLLLINISTGQNTSSPEITSNFTTLSTTRREESNLYKNISKLI